jgi:predicted RNA-binding Zn-ribbon protein involved in translation (DUF1610 family)
MIYLDPEFGSYDNVMDFEIPSGEIVQFYCPHCGTSLQQEHDRVGVVQRQPSQWNCP